MRFTVTALGLLAAALGAQANDGAGATAPGRDEDVLRYVCTYAPIDGDVRRRVADAAAMDDAAAGERKLVEMGEPARRVLVSLAAGRPKLEKRVASVVERLGPLHAEVARRGLDHDVGWLAAAGAPGAERLDRILPKEAPRKDAVAWWTLHGRGYRWEPTADRYVAAPAAATSLRLRDHTRVRFADSANLVSPGSPFTLELWWRSADAATQIYLAGDEGWPELSTDKVRLDTKCGWVLRRIPDGRGAAYLQFCAAVAPNDWWAISSAPLAATQQWEHLALVCSGDAVRIFRDGECVAAGRSDDRRFLRSPTDLYIGPNEIVRDGNDWAVRVAHQDVRGVRLSEGARWKDDFTPPAALEKDGATLALLDFAPGASRLRDVTGHGHDGVNLGGRWTAPLDPDDVRGVFKAVGGSIGDLTFVEAERGAASSDWSVSEREGASDGVIHEIWSSREPDALGHWAKAPFRVEKAGTYRVWYVGGNLERHVDEHPYDYSPFSWRIDDAPAQRVAGGVPTVAGQRVERGLSALGVVDLAAGEHVFELRLTERRGQDAAYSLWFDGLVLERIE
jgi:concanavalin A-like lectin/glucanase superfamily protein